MYSRCDVIKNRALSRLPTYPLTTALHHEVICDKTPWSRISHTVHDNPCRTRRVPNGWFREVLVRHSSIPRQAEWHLGKMLRTERLHFSAGVRRKESSLWNTIRSHTSRHNVERSMRCSPGYHLGSLRVSTSRSGRRFHPPVLCTRVPSSYQARAKLAFPGPYQLLLFSQPHWAQVDSCGQDQ